MAFVTYPAGSLRDIGPGADIRQSLGKSVDVSVDAVNAADLRRQPVVGNHARLVQVREYHFEQGGVFGVADTAKIGDAADIPEQAHGGHIAGPRGHLGHLIQGFQRAKVVGLARLDQMVGTIVTARTRLERADQCFGRSEIEVRAAPVELFDRRETVIHDRLRHAIVQRRGVAGDAERAIGHAAPGPSGDLGQFVGGKGAHAPSVEFGERGESNVVDIEIQTHADGIRGHQIIHLAILIKRHLSVAGARGKCAHYHGSTTFLAADQFGDSIYIFNRKPDYCTSGWHPTYLFRT